MEKRLQIIWMEGVYKNFCIKVRLVDLMRVPQHHTSHLTPHTLASETLCTSECLILFKTEVPSIVASHIIHDVTNYELILNQSTYYKFSFLRMKLGLSYRCLVMIESSNHTNEPQLFPLRPSLSYQSFCFYCSQFTF